MTSNRLFSKTGRLDFTREISWFAVYTLVFFFVMPIALMMQLEDLREAARQLGDLGNTAIQYTQQIGSADGPTSIFVMGKEAGTSEYDLMRTVVSVLGMGMTSLFIGMFAFCEAFHQFSYLYRRREVDFYHGLPQSRTQLYFSRFLNGVLNVVIPYSLMFVLGLLFAAGSGAPFGLLLQVLLPAYLLNLFYFLLIYGLCVVAVMLTGKALTGLFGMCILNGFFPMLYVLIEMFLALWMESYMESGAALEKLIRISPVAQLAECYDWYMEHYYYLRTADFAPQLLYRIPICTIALVIFILTGWFLYRKRSLERAGEAMAFPVSEMPIRVILSLMGGMLGAGFFYSMQEGFGWAIFGMVAGILILHGVIEMIYRNDFRSLLRHKLQLILTVAGGILLLCVFQFDLIGYDSYLPKEAKVREATLQIYDETYPFSYYKEMEDGSYSYIGTDENNEIYMHLTAAEDIEGILELARVGINSQARNGGAAAQLEGSDELGAAEDSQGLIQLYICYQMDNGSRHGRVYEVRKTDLQKIYENIYASEAYKEGLYPVLHMDMEACEEIRYSSYGQTQLLRLNQEEREALIACYQRDLRGQSLRDRQEAYPIGELELQLGREQGETEDMADEYSKPYLTGSVKQGSDTAVIKTPVYPGFAETIAYLQSLDIQADGRQTPDFAGTGQMYYGISTSEEYVEGRIDDPEAIALVKENVVAWSYQWWDPFGPAVIQDLSLRIPYGIDGDESDASSEEIMAEEYAWPQTETIEEGYLLQTPETMELAQKLLEQR